MRRIRITEWRYSIEPIPAHQGISHALFSFKVLKPRQDTSERMRYQPPSATSLTCHSTTPSRLPTVRALGQFCLRNSSSSTAPRLRKMRSSSRKSGSVLYQVGNIEAFRRIDEVHISPRHLACGQLCGMQRNECENLVQLKWQNEQYIECDRRTRKRRELQSTKWPLRQRTTPPKSASPQKRNENSETPNRVLGRKSRTNIPRTLRARRRTGKRT